MSASRGSTTPPKTKSSSHRFFAGSAPDPAMSSCIFFRSGPRAARLPQLSSNFGLPCHPFLGSSTSYPPLSSSSLSPSLSKKFRLLRRFQKKHLHSPCLPCLTRQQTLPPISSESQPLVSCLRFHMILLASLGRTMLYQELDHTPCNEGAQGGVCSLDKASGGERRSVPSS